jgi:hypothetical protein
MTEKLVRDMSTVECTCLPQVKRFLVLQRGGSLDVLSRAKASCKTCWLLAIQGGPGDVSSLSNPSTSESSFPWLGPVAEVDPTSCGSDSLDEAVWEFGAALNRPLPSPAIAQRYKQFQLQNIIGYGCLFKDRGRHFSVRWVWTARLQSAATEMRFPATTWGRAKPSLSVYCNGNEGPQWMVSARPFLHVSGELTAATFTESWV